MRLRHFFKKTGASILIGGVAVTGLGAITAPPASAFGQCGGPSYTTAGLLHNWKGLKVTSQFAKVEQKSGFRPVDQSLTDWMNERVIEGPTTRPSKTDNFGCQPGKVFKAGTKVLPKGHPVFAELPAKFAKSDVSTRAHKGWPRIEIRTNIVADTGCSNAHNGIVYMNIWLKPKPKHVQKTTPVVVPPAPKPAPTVIVTPTPAPQPTVTATPPPAPAAEATAIAISSPVIIVDTTVINQVIVTPPAPQPTVTPTAPPKDGALTPPAPITGPTGPIAVPVDPSSQPCYALDGSGHPLDEYGNCPPGTRRM